MISFSLFWISLELHTEISNRAKAGRRHIDSPGFLLVLAARRKGRNEVFLGRHVCCWQVVRRRQRKWLEGDMGRSHTSHILHRQDLRLQQFTPPMHESFKDPPRKFRALFEFHFMERIYAFAYIRMALQQHHSSDVHTIMQPQYISVQVLLN